MTDPREELCAQYLREFEEEREYYRNANRNPLGWLLLCVLTGVFGCVVIGLSARKASGAEPRFQVENKTTPFTVVNKTAPKNIQYQSTCNCLDRYGACACKPSECVCPNCDFPGSNVPSPAKAVPVRPFPAGYPGFSNSTRTTLVPDAVGRSWSSSGSYPMGSTFTPARGAFILGGTSGGCLTGG